MRSSLTATGGSPFQQDRSRPIELGNGRQKVCMEVRHEPERYAM